MIHQRLQAAERLVANIAHPDARKISEEVSVIAEDDALSSSMNENILQSETSDLASVAVKSSRRYMIRFVLEHQLVVVENSIAELTLKDFRNVNCSNELGSG